MLQVAMVVGTSQTYEGAEILKVNAQVVRVKRTTHKEELGCWCPLCLSPGSRSSPHLALHINAAPTELCVTHVGQSQRCWFKRTEFRSHTLCHCNSSSSLAFLNHERGYFLSHPPLVSQPL